MKIIVKDPDTQVELELDAMPEQRQEYDGWQIQFPDGKEIFIYEKQGRWHSDDAVPGNRQLVQQIGESIKPVE